MNYGKSSWFYAVFHRTGNGDRVADGLLCLLYGLPVVCKCRCLSAFRKERRQKNGITLYAFSGCGLFDELLVIGKISWFYGKVMR